MNKEKLMGSFEDKMDFYRCSDVFLAPIRKNNCTIDKYREIIISYGSSSPHKLLMSRELTWRIPPLYSF